MFAWTHDEQNDHPTPRFLTLVTDAHPAPGPALPRWRVDWTLWGDTSGPGWRGLTLWERHLAYSFLLLESPDLQRLHQRLAEVTAPLSPEDYHWLLQAPALKAPDPVSFFKLRTLKVFQRVSAASPRAWQRSP